jgi:hypothetical protein
MAVVRCAGWPQRSSAGMPRPVHPDRSCEREHELRLRSGREAHLGGRHVGRAASPRWLPGDDRPGQPCFALSRPGARPLRPRRRVGRREARRLVFSAAGYVHCRYLGSLVAGEACCRVCWRHSRPPGRGGLGLRPVAPEAVRACRREGVRRCCQGACGLRARRRASAARPMRVAYTDWEASLAQVQGAVCVGSRVHPRRRTWHGQVLRVPGKSSMAWRRPQHSPAAGFEDGPDWTGRR